MDGMIRMDNIVLIIISLCSFIIGLVIGNIKKETVYEEMIARLLNNNKTLINEINEIRTYMNRESRRIHMMNNK